MDDSLAREAARILWDAWQSGRRVKALPQPCRPTTRAEGYLIQAAMLALSGRAPCGWKIAATSAAGQAHIGVDGPLAGRLLSGQIDEDGATVSLGNTQMRVAEVEFAFRMGRELAPRDTPYNVDEVLAAVDTLHPAIEIPDSRYEDFVHAGAPQLIADNACAHYFVLGAAAPPAWRDLDLAAHAVAGEVVGRVRRDGIGANVLGDPRVALAWLVNELSGLGITLAAGHVVTTGTCLVPLPIEAGDHVRADFGRLGVVDVHFVP